MHSYSAFHVGALAASAVFLFGNLQAQEEKKGDLRPRGGIAAAVASPQSDSQSDSQSDAKGYSQSGARALARAFDPANPGEQILQCSQYFALVDPLTGKDTNVKLNNSNDYRAVVFDKQIQIHGHATDNTVLEISYSAQPYLYDGPAFTYDGVNLSITISQYDGKKWSVPVSAYGTTWAGGGLYLLSQLTNGLGMLQTVNFHTFATVKSGLKTRIIVSLNTQFQTEASIMPNILILRY